MIRKYNEFIREFLDTGNSILDIKMQEIKELVDSVGGQTFMYEWENKNDHELFVNFSTNELVLRYEFDIDSLMIKKIASNVVDFETKVSSIEEGLDIIEKDIHSILGISENFDNELDEDLILSLMKDKGWGDLGYDRIEDFKDSDYNKSWILDEDDFVEQFDLFLNDEVSDSEYLDNKSGEGRDIYDDFEEESNKNFVIEKNTMRYLKSFKESIGNYDSSLTTKDIQSIYPMVKKILKIYPGESADSEGIVVELERKLNNYDDIVSEEVIDILMFGNPDLDYYTFEREMVDLGDRIREINGTEQIMVINAFKDAFEVIGNHFYLNEKLFLESKYEESISIVIEAGEGNAYIKNRFSNLEINRKLMKILNKEFNLNIDENSDKNKIENSKVSEISKFLTSIGLSKKDEKTTERIKLTFTGKLTLKDIKKLRK